MTGSKDSRQWVAIGAFELKKCYQSNMIIATLTVTLFAAALVVLGNILGHTSGKVIACEDGDSRFIYTYDATKVMPPPSVEEQPEEHGDGLRVTPADNVLVEGGDDESADIESTLLTRRQRRELVPGRPAGGGRMYARWSVTDKPQELEEDTFALVQKLPILLKQVSPEYPKLARRTGVEASVTVNVLIRTDGTVSEAVIVEDTGLNVGFEEAALAAAYETIWEPAEQNGQPVEIWVTYKVLFRLRR